MSLNPFTNRRKKQEEAVEEKQREQMQQLQQLQAQQYQMRAQQDASFAPPPSSGGFDLPKSSDDAYDISNLNQHLPASAQVDQEKPRGGWKMPSFGSGDVYGSYEAPSRMRSCFTKLQYGARRRAAPRPTPRAAAAAAADAARSLAAAAALTCSPPPPARSPPPLPRAPPAQASPSAPRSEARSASRTVRSPPSNTSTSSTCRSRCCRWAAPSASSSCAAR